MTKKRIIKVIILVSLIIVTKLIFYFVVGKNTCLQEEPIRTLWLCIPLAFLIIDIVFEDIIEKDKK